MPEQPTGTVTFLYTDVEGSTLLWEQHPDAMKAAIVRHDAILRTAVQSSSGVVFRTVGDGLCAAFATAPEAVEAALAGQLSLKDEPSSEIGPLRVRMALHTGAAEVQAGDYVGACLNRVARLLGLGHGGQVLLSQATYDLVRDAPTIGATLRDMGEQRLRDLIRPEHVYQLVHPDLAASFPSLRSLDSYPNNLPLQLTSFVGRGQEIAEVRRLLHTTRLLTLVGTGGCGKTRLALQLAADVLDEFADGVWVAELASVSDPALVAQTAAQAFGVRSESGGPILSVLTDYLKSRRLLLVLDNCEHVLQACAELVNALLRACPRLAVLATSRELLGTAGEVAWRVPSLSAPPADGTPSVESLAKYEAVRLFAERAVAVQPAFTVTCRNAFVVAQLCWRLDGIPLAIELAAARTRGMTVEQIVARLNDRFRLLTGGNRTGVRRQQTLRAAIDWSYDLLTTAERVVLRRLAVFAGGCTLEAAETVCAGSSSEESVDAADVLDLLLRLVDRSLVVAEEQGEETRYRLLETIRQYAGEMLFESGEGAAVHDRHRDWCVELAERAEPELVGRNQRRWQDRLERDHDNLRVALAWCLETNAPIALRLAMSLSEFWSKSGHFTEGRRWFEAGLAQVIDRTVLRGRALGWVALLATSEQEIGLAEVLAREGLAICREIGDARGIARALFSAGRAAGLRGDRDRQRALYDESLIWARRGGDQPLVELILPYMGMTAHFAGDYERARGLYEESLASARERDYGTSVGWNLTRLGYLAACEGDYRGGRKLLEEGLDHLRAVEDVPGIAGNLVLLGDVLRVEGEHHRARAILEESLALRRRIGGRFGIRLILERLAWLARTAGRASEVTSQVAELAGLQRAAEIVSDPFLFWFCGILAVGWGQPRRAARLFGASASHGFDAWRGYRLPADQAEIDAALADARLALGETTFSTVWAEGEAMTLEQAVEYALSGDGTPEPEATTGPSAG